jgi:alkanesulfonate monooxygenase SsuD/methylene tetrahydromethanopterin reductase-like flavin-dependent oxidoreductase (luciferase family)
MATLQFGLGLSTAAGTGSDPIAEALAAERLGFDFVSASDHPHGEHPSYETWTLLTTVAARTSRLKIASRVLSVPFRPPALVAKMAESLDRLSGGRLILGLGGGSGDDELRAFGLGVPTPGEKVRGLDEAVTIVRGLWTEASFTFSGTRFHTEAARIEPKPAHAIPIWLGTFGDRALAITGRLADGWIPSLGYAPPDVVVVMRDKLRTAAQAAGRDPEAITCAYNVPVRVDDRAGGKPAVVTGPPDAVAEQLQAFVGLGFTAFNLMPMGPGLDDQIERLATDVLPTLRPAP